MDNPGEERGGEDKGEVLLLIVGAVDIDELGVGGVAFGGGRGRHRELVFGQGSQ